MNLFTYLACLLPAISYVAVVAATVGHNATDPSQVLEELMKQAIRALETQTSQSLGCSAKTAVRRRGWYVVGLHFCEPHPTHHTLLDLT